LALDEYCGIIGNPGGDAPENPVLQSLPYSSIAPLVVKHSDLAALLPRRLALLFARDFELDIVELPQRECMDGLRISAVWHPDYGTRAPTIWFRNLLTEVVAGHDLCPAKCA
jgi:DNA-binding transcriptional LysR family regulator